MNNKVFGNFKNIIQHFISVTDLNKRTSLIINDVIEKEEPYVIVKNNVPAVVLISIKEYSELTEARDKLQGLENENKENTKI